VHLEPGLRLEDVDRRLPGVDHVGEELALQPVGAVEHRQRFAQHPA
jgi:hypothetical protein